MKTFVLVLSVWFLDGTSESVEIGSGYSVDTCLDMVDETRRLIGPAVIRLEQGAIHVTDGKIVDGLDVNCQEAKTWR